MRIVILCKKVRDRRQAVGDFLKLLVVYFLVLYIYKTLKIERFPLLIHLCSIFILAFIAWSFGSLNLYLKYNNHLNISESAGNNEMYRV